VSGRSVNAPVAEVPALSTALASDGVGAGVAGVAAAQAFVAAIMRL
jgi:hypothetical protein